MSSLVFKTRRGRLDFGQLGAVWSRFGKYVSPHRWALTAAFMGAIGTIAMQIAAPWPIKIIFDHILSDNMSSSRLGRVLSSIASNPTSTLLWVCGAILLIAILDAVFCHMRDVLLAQTGQRIVGKVRQDLFAHLQTLSPATFERKPTGDLLMRLTGDIQMLRQMLVNSVINAGQSCLMIIAMAGAMIWLNPTLALIGFATIPLMLWSSLKISKQIRKATKGQREKESIVATIAHDVLGSMPIIQAFNREPIEQKRFSRQNRSSVRAGVKTTKLESKLARIISISSAVALCAILYVGVRSVLAGAMTAGDLLVFLSYLRALQKPMRKLAKLTSQLAKATSCGQRVAELFAISPAVASRPDAKDFEGIHGDIHFQDVTFGYDADLPAVSDVTLSIQSGQRIALVGHTGAGKSTLIKLLLRFSDPWNGTIQIDGMDIRNATLESLRQQIGWVHQDTILFGLTVAENIAFACHDADLDRIQEVARQVQADEFIQTLPDGYDTILGQGGQTLSGGQRQRIALARALLRSAPILLLDEPVTGLDGPTRRLVEQSWMSPKNRATTIVICHRLNDMHRFDCIVVLAKGKVAQTGTHDELIRAGGEYGKLFFAGNEKESPSSVAEQAIC